MHALATEHDKDLSPSQMAKIRKYLSDRGALHRAIGSTLTTRRRSPRARLLAKGDFEKVRASVTKQLGEIGPRIRELICDRLDWCKNKKQKTYHFVVSIVKALLPQINKNVATIANIIFMVQEFMFDQLCKCPD